MAVRLLQGKQIATASWAQNAVTSSYAQSASFAVSASWAPTQNIDTSSLVTTSSFNAFTSSYYQDSSSFNSRIINTNSNLTTVSSSLNIRVTNLEQFSSSLDSTFATDAQLNQATASLSSSISILSSSYLQSSASFSSNITQNSSSISSVLNTFNNFTSSYNTGSFTGSFTGSLLGTASFAVSASWAPTQNIDTSSLVTTSSFNAFTSSYNTGSFTGSFTGDGAGLYNIPASGIIGLNLSQISSGSVSASISPENGLQVNTNVTATSFTGSLQGVASTASFAPNYTTTSSFNSFTSSYYQDSSSFDTRIDNLEQFSSSLDAIFVTDAQLNQATSSLSSSISSLSSSFLAFTASYNTGSFTGSFTGSLFGTASWATNAITATNALNGGVTQLLAGPNVTLSPTNGLGQVTISSTGGGGSSFNTATGSYGSFYSTSSQSNPVANIPRSMSLDNTDITNGVSVSGSTNPFNTYIKTENAGVYNIQFSAQLDKTDSGADEVVIWLRKNGTDLTDSATTITLNGNNDKQVAAWNWFINSAANDYYQIIWRSLDTDLRLLAEPISGTHPGIPSVIVTVNRVDQFLSNTGSFSGSFTGQFTGSLFGTSSWSFNSTTSSFVTASNVFGPFGSNSILSSSFAVSSSRAVSSSFATSASFAISSSRALNANNATTASYALTSSIVQSIASNISNNANSRLLSATGGDNIQGLPDVFYENLTLKISKNLKQADGIVGEAQVYSVSNNQIVNGVLNVTGDESEYFSTGSTLLVFDNDNDTVDYYAIQNVTYTNKTTIELVDTSINVNSTSLYVADIKYLQGNSGDSTQNLPINSAHAQGASAQALGLFSHAEGGSKDINIPGGLTLADGSHAEGLHTIALGVGQHVQGQFNIPSTAQSAFIIGNGTDNNNRSNLVFASGSQFQVTGSIQVSGSITTQGNITMPNRPAFRVMGTSINSISATTTISGSAVAVEFNQGIHYNQSTGRFTAPVAGLYQVNVVCKTASNSNSGINQIIVRKQLPNDGATTAQIMLEWAKDTTVNHMGGSSIVRMAVGDTLRVDVTAGAIIFDENDNFSVAYIG